jgi:hypothetical protein
MTATAPRTTPRHRLTDAQRRDREMTEAGLQSLVTELAGMYGFVWVHFRAGLRANGRWYVPVEGPLGKGWPDLVLVRVRDARLLFVELKRETERPSADQAAILAALATVGETYVWRPSDLTDGRILAVLAGHTPQAAEGSRKERG